MTILEHGFRHLNEMYRANHSTQIGSYLFLLKRLGALSVVILGVGLIFATLWLAFTRSIYLVIIVIAVAAAGFLVSYLLAMPLLHPKRTKPQYTPADLDLPSWEEVRFFSSDGIELHGWFIPPNRQSNGATLVCVHGLGSNRGQLLAQAAVMISRGYGALLFDLRNHGASCGNLTTLGYAEAEDVRGAVNYVLSRPEVNSNRIGLIGYSMGGAAVLRAATRLPFIKAIVIESTYTSLEDNIEQGMIAKTGLPPFPFAPIMIWFGERITGLHIQQIRPIDEIARLKQPVLFVHGTQDKTVDAVNSLRLYAAASEPKGLYMVRGAGHDGLLGADPFGFERYVLGFLDCTLNDGNHLSTLA